MAAEDIKAAIKLEAIERGRIHKKIWPVTGGFKPYKRSSKNLLED
jgi:hypothetical protein